MNPGDAPPADGPLPSPPDLQSPPAPSACALAIHQEERPGADWSCQTPNSCVDDYLGFPSRALAFRKPITEMELQEQFARIRRGEVMLKSGPLPAAELRDTIVEATNLRELLTGIETRPLQVTVTRRVTTKDYEERDLLLTDPYVGTTRAVLLLPLTPGPHPAVVAIHGHGDSAEIYRDKYHGAEFPAHGYVILMLTMRAFNIDKDENKVWHDLMREGHSLIGLRVYEALLGRKYLRCQPEVSTDRIGLIGHSGGSSTGNLTVRIELGFAAYVSDHKVDWYNKDLFEVNHCENQPALYPYHPLLSDFQTSAVPVKTVPYGYTNGVGEIFDFFARTLKP